MRASASVCTSTTIRDVSISGNTIISATASGLLYQNSTGSAENNTLFANSAGTMYAHQATVVGAQQPGGVYGQHLAGNPADGRHACVDNATQLTQSDDNHFYHANRTAHIAAAGNKTLAQWRSYAAQDAGSTEMISATLASAEIFYNDTTAATTVVLPRPYVDLNGQPAADPVTLQPFASQILLPSGPGAVLDDHRCRAALVQASATITYTLEIANRGGAAATNLVVTSTVPAGTAYRSGGVLDG